MTIDIETLELLNGAHGSRSEGVCLLEAVAWFAGEPHTDHPACVSPVLSAFGRSWNDALPDDERQKLKPYVPRLVGTSGDAAADTRRAWMTTDWLVRVHTPAWLRLAGLDEQAAQLEALLELVSADQIPPIKPVLEAVRKDAAAAGAAARDAAGDAAWAAARDAARDAAGAAAGDAAWAAAGAAAGAAARDAAGAAAGAAARAAAGAAAGDAAWAAAGAAAWKGEDVYGAAYQAVRAAVEDSVGAKVAGVRDELIASAHQLYDRMIDAGERADGSRPGVGGVS